MLTGVADVAEAGPFTNAHDLPVAICCGRRSAAGHVTCDGELVIDLAPMKGMYVAAARSRAYAHGGLLWGILIAKFRSTALLR